MNYQAIFAIEGKYVKYGYNKMLRRPGYPAPSGALQYKKDMDCGYVKISSLFNEKMSG